MVSMLHALVEMGGDRPVSFIHGARDGARHPLAGEVRALAAQRPGTRVHIAYSRPRAEDKAGADYDSEGRLDGGLLRKLVGEVDAHYMLCGPTRFMAEIQTDLERRGVPAARIHTESFGPAG
jgi:ferredoxin-NADP reductase